MSGDQMESHVSTSGKYCWHKFHGVFSRMESSVGKLVIQVLGVAPTVLFCLSGFPIDFLELVVIYLLCFSMLRLVNGKLKGTYKVVASLSENTTDIFS
jgi:hypothetical protein